VDTTFAKYFDKWFVTYREPKIREVTAQKYIVVSKHIDKAKLGQKKLKEIKRKDVQEFLNEYGAKRRKKTVLDTRRLINASFVYAVHDGLIKINPCARTEVVSIENNWDVKELKKVREEKKWLEIDEYKRTKLYLLGLLNAMFLQDKAVMIKFEDGKHEIVKSIHERKYPTQMVLIGIYVALKTGARIAEVLGLTKNDIDLERKTIKIEKTWDYKFSRTFVETKNTASIREVSVDNEFATVMKIYYKWLEKQNITLDQGALLVEKGIGVFSSTFNGVLKNIFGVLKIQPITMHKLRHTQASILIAQGVSLQVVAKRLGHTDTNMIQTTYGHLLESVEEKENERIFEVI
jgi:integrase